MRYGRIYQAGLGTWILKQSGRKLESSPAQKKRHHLARNSYVIVCQVILFLCEVKMAFSEFEKKKIQKIIGQYIEKNRPQAEIRDKVDLSYKLSGQSVELFEIRPLWNNPNEKIEEPIAKATYVKTQKLWKVYWQRADLKWHRYEPDPEVNTIEEFVSLVENDEYACFFG